MAATVTGTKNNTDGNDLLDVDFIKKALGDCIPDDVMNEIVRRLIVSLRADATQDIVRSEEQPQDRSKLWYRPSTKLLYAFNPETGTWETTNVENFSICISASSASALKKDAEGCLVLDSSLLAGKTEYFEGSIASDASGNVTKTVSFSLFTDAKATVAVIPLSDFGASYRWWVSNQTTSTVSVSFSGLAASTSFNVRIAVLKS